MLKFVIKVHVGMPNKALKNHNLEELTENRIISFGSMLKMGLFQKCKPAMLNPRLI